MSFLRNWPEGLFVLLVIVFPLAFASLMPARSFGGFIVRIVLGMLAGGLVWLAIVVVAVGLSRQEEEDEHYPDEEDDIL
ncbi:MAG: hypothetical protein L0Y72_28845 [Gemmataceae bacterium]|nr:hypothetical protein [Gemmataceae bacterium]MCI0743056.1 hypothetical protein [Gemmataceae bacterium]